MNDSSYSVILQNLSSDYYHGQIDFEDYRIQRKIVLDKVDEELNGFSIIDNDPGENNNKEDFFNTITYVQNTDINT
ncbi:MAG: hypothetical protein OEY09_10005 [Gammaproteobacteria bacterium]|nr:hypothetical protein [Gammaproteobacteria bacterium]